MATKYIAFALQPKHARGSLISCLEGIDKQRLPNDSVRKRPPSYYKDHPRTSSLWEYSCKRSMVTALGLELGSKGEHH